MAFFLLIVTAGIGTAWLQAHPRVLASLDGTRMPGLR